MLRRPVAFRLLCHDRRGSTAVASLRVLLEFKGMIEFEFESPSDIFCLNLRMPLEEHRQAPVDGDGDGDAVTRDDDNGDEDEQRTCTGLRMCLPVNSFGLQTTARRRRPLFVAASPAQ